MRRLVLQNIAELGEGDLSVEEHVAPSSVLCLPHWQQTWHFDLQERTADDCAH
eukprot:m.483666 g.483666  ORF g.483666 m.483666 type:complete len:53 (+) comp66256_c0_seq1:218-376(+)